MSFILKARKKQRLHISVCFYFVSIVFLPRLVDLLSTTTVGAIMKETIPAKGEVKIAALGTLTV